MFKRTGAPTKEHNYSTYTSSTDEEILNDPDKKKRDHGDIAISIRSKRVYMFDEDLKDWQDTSNE